MTDLICDLYLVPITIEEKAEFEQNDDIERVYVLYRTSESDEIKIGMMSLSMRKCFPELANVDGLAQATSKAYFFNGYDELAKSAREIVDRPVYRIELNDNRSLNKYTVINATEDNEMAIDIDLVLTGKYNLKPQKALTLKRAKYIDKWR